MATYTYENCVCCGGAAAECQACPLRSDLPDLTTLTLSGFVDHPISGAPHSCINGTYPLTQDASLIWRFSGPCSFGTVAIAVVCGGLTEAEGLFQLTVSWSAQFFNQGHWTAFARVIEGDVNCDPLIANFDEWYPSGETEFGPWSGLMVE